jgi:hypothetical protein
MEYYENIVSYYSLLITPIIFRIIILETGNFDKKIKYYLQMIHLDIEYIYNIFLYIWRNLKKTEIIYINSILFEAITNLIFILYYLQFWNISQIL